MTDTDATTIGADPDPEVLRLAGSLGAELRGIDLRTIDDATVAFIRRALTEHLVLFFPAQFLTPDEHRDFARRFGPLENHPYLPKVDEQHPELSVFDNGRADLFHSDVTFMETPPFATVFQYAQGPDVGGDTLWSNTYDAYETLSPPIRDLLDGLTAYHDGRVYGHPEHNAVHPAVRLIPETGRRCLFVNRALTVNFVELSRRESNTLMAMLFDHIEQPAFTVRWRWNPGDVAIWDNRCSQHHAINDYGESPHRIVHRAIVIESERPANPSIGRWSPYADPRPLGLGARVAEVKYP